MTPLRKLRALLSRRRLEREMAAEMRAHVEEQRFANVSLGMAPAEAEYAARRQFGHADGIKELTCDRRRIPVIEDGLRDGRYALRVMAKNPGFTVVTVLTLALGLGATATIFTAADALFLRSLPVREPERLVLVAQSTAGEYTFSYPAYARFRDQMRSVDLAAVQSFTTRRWVKVGGGNEPVETQLVSGNLFSAFGIVAQIGRALTAEDDRPGQDGVMAVISDAFWHQQFGGDPGVVGRAVSLGDGTVTIVGVMPRGFRGFQVGVPVDLWWPMQAARVFREPAGMPPRLESEGWDWLFVVGRLGAGVTPGQAAADLQMVFQRRLVAIAESDGAKWTEKQRAAHFQQGVHFEPGGAGFTSLRARFASPLRIVAAAAGVLLLITCANVAGLLIARGLAREREFSVRVAMGAPRMRLVRQLMTEGMILALAGGTAAWVLADWGTSVLATFLPSRGGAIDLAPGWMTFVFLILASIGATVLFALLPALWVSRPAAGMRMGASSGRGVHPWLQHGLVVLQVALSVALLMAAGLFARTIQNLQSVDLGFRRENQLVFLLEAQRALTTAERTALSDRVLEAVSALPGVGDVTQAAGGLLTGEGLGTRFSIDGYTPGPDEVLRALFMVVGPRFFETLEIPIIRGRAPELPPVGRSESAEGVSQIIINQAMARRYFGDTDPIGRTLRQGIGATRPLEIVGVAADTKYRSVRETSQPQFYVPYSGDSNYPKTFYVRAAVRTGALVASIRDAVRTVDPALRAVGIRPLDDIVDDTLVAERVIAKLAGFFSLAALGLAGLGLYGVLTFGVVQRTREIGIRMALGASAAGVLRLVVGQGLTLALLGAAAGVVAGGLSVRVAKNVLYAVTPFDPETLAAVIGVLLLIAALAAWLPARRAARVDPMEALRTE